MGTYGLNTHFVLDWEPPFLKWLYPQSEVINRLRIETKQTGLHSKIQGTYQF